MFSKEQLSRSFRNLGIVPGDTVMLDASIRAVGEVAGGPDQIHLALKDAHTVEGTLMMYASCPKYTDEVGRGHLTAEQEQEILEKFPASIGVRRVSSTTSVRQRIFPTDPVGAVLPEVFEGGDDRVLSAGGRPVGSREEGVHHPNPEQS